MGLSSTKNIAQIQAEAGEEGAHTLKRTLTATNLVMLGIGAIIGAGIFVLTGTAAAQYAGPAVVISFVLAVSPARRYKLADRLRRTGGLLG